MTEGMKPNGHGHAPDLGRLPALLREAASRHRTASAAVTEALRRAIVGGVMPGGMRLRQDDLAATLGTSRMPIREAIRNLEAEGLVAFEPHRGAMVATLLAEDVLELSELRVALESLALSLSLPELPEAALDAADAVLTAMDQEPSAARRSALNRRFHALLYSGVRRPRLARQIDTLYDAFDRYLRVEHRELDRERRSQEEHRRILDACRRRNLAVALGELRSHIADPGQALAALLRRRSAEVGSGL